MANPFKTAKDAITNRFSNKSQVLVVSDLARAESQYGYDAVSVSMLLGSGRRTARSRVEIYNKLHFMMGDPIIASAIRLHSTNILGGDPKTGNRVFIEMAAGKDTPANKKIVDELNSDLLYLFNKIAFQITYNSLGFGDAYARPYVKDKIGIVDIYTDEMIWPPLVQSYEQGSETAGFTVSVGKNAVERLTLKQMVRMRMPRLGYVAQNNVIQKAILASLTEDDPDKLPYTPSLIGGSILLTAEEPYDQLQTALFGMVGQRIKDSSDETIITYNSEGMTKSQHDTFNKAFKSLLEKSKARTEAAIASGEIKAEKYYHLFPVNGDKQMIQVTPFQNTSGAQSYNVDDVMFHMKRLTGALGLDLSLLGWAELMSGGLGEGGFFRTSAQGAEISLQSRPALIDFFNDLMDLHCFYRYGNVFSVEDRPYGINFYGSISALENEKASSREKAMNGTMLMGQALDSLKNLGLSEETNKQIMTSEMQLDEDLADNIAKDMKAVPPESGFGNDKE